MDHMHYILNQTEAFLSPEGAILSFHNDSVNHWDLKQFFSTFQTKLTFGSLGTGPFLKSIALKGPITVFACGWPR